MSCSLYSNFGIHNGGLKKCNPSVRKIELLLPPFTATSGAAKPVTIASDP
jgi:hypothetical protein